MALNDPHNPEKTLGAELINHTEVSRVDYPVIPNSEELRSKLESEENRLDDLSDKEKSSKKVMAQVKEVDPGLDNIATDLVSDRHETVILAIDPSREALADTSAGVASQLVKRTEQCQSKEGESVEVKKG